MNSLGLLGKQILGEGRNWAPGSAKGEEKETGRSREEAPSHSRDADPL